MIPLALNAEQRFGYLACVLVGQAIIETGYGQTDLAQEGLFNVLGMKRELLNSTWTSDYWHGGTHTKVTPEWTPDGEEIHITDVFRTYDSYQDCFYDYCQFMQDAKEVNDTKAGLSVKREIIAKNGQPKVGDKVVVRITIKAERNLDFVEVIDRRPACMEPVEQRSGYRRGCYIAPKDYTTCYYFDKMAKGTHVIETEYYIDRTGTYESGTCKAQCAYAPEFSATTKAFKIIVNK